MTDSERINELQLRTGLTWKELANKIGLSTPQAFVDIRAGRHGISKGLAAKIVAAFPDIRQEWVLFGSGPMSKEMAAQEIPIYDTGGDPIATSKPTARINVGSCFPRAEMAMKNTSDSMIEYPLGCILILRRVTDKNLLVPGFNYVVETKDFCVAKRLQKGDDGEHITLYSTNQTVYSDGRLIYEPFMVPLEAVTRVYAIMGYIYTQTNEITPVKV